MAAQLSLLIFDLIVSININQNIFFSCWSLLSICWLIQHEPQMLLSETDQDSSLQMQLVFVHSPLMRLSHFWPSAAFSLSALLTHIYHAQSTKEMHLKQPAKTFHSVKEFLKQGLHQLLFTIYIVLSLENFAEQALFYNLQDFPLNQFVFADKWALAIMAQISLSPFYNYEGCHVQVEVFFPKLGNFWLAKCAVINCKSILTDKSNRDSLEPFLDNC